MGMGGGIEIGGVEEKELDAMLRLMCQAFDLPYEAARGVFYADPYFHLANKRVLRVGGQIVSCLTIVEAACRLGAGVVQVAGIAGVATRQNERKQGYAGLLLKETLTELRRRGDALSALIPYDYAYYRKFGWEMAGTGFRARIKAAHLPRYPDYLHVRPAVEADIAELERLYNESAEGRALRCLRDAKRWRYLMTYIPHCLIYAPHGGKATGYLLCDFQAIPQKAADAATELEGTQTQSKRLRILEMAAATPEAQRGWIGYLARQEQAAEIEHASDWQGLVESGLLRPALTPQNTLSANVEIVPTIMARIVDLAKLAESLKPDWKGFQGALLLKMTDPLLPAGQTMVLVQGDAKDGVQTREIGSETGLSPSVCVIEGDVHAWSQVVVGHLGAAEACGLGRLTPSRPQADVLAAQLFPPRSPFLPPPDHF